MAQKNPRAHKNKIGLPHGVILHEGSEPVSRSDHKNHSWAIAIIKAHPEKTSCATRAAQQAHTHTPLRRGEDADIWWSSQNKLWGGDSRVSQIAPKTLVAQCSATPATVSATPLCSATPFQTQISVRHLPGQGGARCDTKIFRGVARHRCYTCKTL